MAKDARIFRARRNRTIARNTIKYQFKTKEFMINYKKIYLVSLAVRVPANYEIEVEAENEDEARDKAIEAYNQRNYEDGRFVDVDWWAYEAQPAWDEKMGDGIYIKNR